LLLFKGHITYSTHTQPSYHTHTALIPHTHNPHTTHTQPSYHTHTTLIPHTHNPHTTHTQHSYHTHTTLTPHTHNPHTTLRDCLLEYINVIFRKDTKNFSYVVCEIPNYLTPKFIWYLYIVSDQSNEKFKITPDRCDKSKNNIFPVIFYPFVCMLTMTLTQI
jgi:hypothetical protein